MSPDSEFSDPLDPNAPQPSNAAVDMIRAKVSEAYGTDTNPLASQTTPPESKHQAYMRQLNESGMTLTDIQAAWHQYYLGLPDDEKQQVWDEFYNTNQKSAYHQAYQAQKSFSQSPADQSSPLSAQPITNNDAINQTPIAPAGRVANIPGRLVGVRKRIRKKKEEGGGIADHLQSLTFGLSIGGIVLLVIMFSFFNHFIIGPFIQPSRNVEASPIISTDGSTVTETQPTITITKINLQIPAIFDVPDNSEANIQKGLERGIVHYPSTVLPGQNGNSAYFGHSSRNIFSSGENRYKFAFASLHKLENGDIFYITYSGKRYAYEVIAKEIVAPTQVSILDDTKGEKATAVLVTCNPPGFNTNRLVVWGKQISPSPSTNTEAAPVSERPQTAPETISSNSQPLWVEIWDNITFWDN